MEKRIAGSIRKSLLWLSVLAVFSVLNETVFNVSLPDIAAQFEMEPSAANWVNTSFILSFAAGTAVYGKLSDVFGVKKLLLVGLSIYGGGSLIGLLFHYSFPALLAARFIQGAGISAIPGLIMVIVAGSIEQQHQGKAFGTIGSAVALGEGVGPIIGGLIAGYVHWSYLFVLPLMTMAALPFFLRTLPDEPARRRKLDVVGGLLFVLGIVAFALFTTTYDWRHIAISVVLFIGFGLRIRGAKEPFLEPALFQRKSFVAVVLAGGLVLGTVAGFVSMIPYMMRDVHQMATSVIGAGVLFPGTMGVIFFGIVGGAWVDKRGARFVALAGLSLIAAGLLTASLMADEIPWIVSGSLVLTFGGLSFVKTVVSTMAVKALGADEAGSGMGMLNLCCFLAEGIGVAIVGGLLAQYGLGIRLLPTVTVAAAHLYSNVALLLLAATAAGAIIFLSVCRGRKDSDRPFLRRN